MKKLNLRCKLLFWTLFIGIGAIVGFLMMMIDPSGVKWGMEPLLPMLQILPFESVLFQNFFFSGFMLLLIIGVPELLAAYLLLRRYTWAVWAVLFSGVVLMLWIVFEWYLFGFNALSNIYFLFGLAETLRAVQYSRTLKESPAEKE